MEIVSIIIIVLGIVLGGWILSLVLGIKLARARRALREIRADDLPMRPAPAPVLDRIQDFLALRLELKGLAHSDALEPERFEQLSNEIDKRLAADLAKAGADPIGSTWTCRRDTAWRILVAHGAVPAGPPPWQAATQCTLDETETESESAAEPECYVSPWPQQPSEPEPPITEPTQCPKPVISTDTPNKLPSPQYSAAEPRRPESPVSPKEHAWRPSLPNAMENALRSVAGWPKAMLPFLVQNVGWFIGVFCFLAGSVFLVSYTSGFTKALTVFGALFTYTGFLIWAGYRLRARRPEVKTASYALLTMGMLLVPLNFSAAARLVLYAGDAWWLGAIGVVTTAVMVSAFYFAARLISGMNDRALQKQHAGLFLGLAGVQLAVPLVAAWPHWTLLALTHLLLLAMLGYGLLRNIRDWMQTVFVERRKTVYFAAGTLLYAAVVSFVHLTFGAADLSLPRGYFAPYLMAVCGLLFYLDAELKLETRPHAFLSHFTFFVYGLSTLAVFLALDAPVARALTLVLAAGIYGAMLWKYLTLVPFYLLLASLSGLYASLVLTQVSPGLHFIAGLPGLAALFAFSRWARRLADGRAAGVRLALMSYRTLLVLLVGAFGWSLIHSEPGILATMSALVLAGALWWLLADAPGPLLKRSAANDNAFIGAGMDLRNSPWLYSVSVALTFCVALSPPLLGLGWTIQFALGLAALGVLWTSLLLRAQRSVRDDLTPQYEVFANSALVSVFAALALAISVSARGTLPLGTLSIVAAAAAGVLLALSLGLYVRWLFYGFLVTAGLAGALIKLAFFHGPSIGMMEMLLALGLWFFVWWFDRQPSRRAEMRAERARRERLTLLWWFPTIEADKVQPLSQIALPLPSVVATCDHAALDIEEPAHV